MASPLTITNINNPLARCAGSGSATSSDRDAVVLTVFDPEAFESTTRFANVLDTKELAAATSLKDAKKKGLLEERRRRFWSSTHPSSNSAANFDADTERSNIDAELGGAYLPQCLEEIKTRLVIKSHPIYAHAQETWTARKREFTDRVDRKQKSVFKLTNDVYQLVGVLSVFQGVLYTGVSQSNLLHCNNRWSPITLSVVASVIVVAGIIDKLLRIREFQRIIHSAQQSLKIVEAKLNALERLGVEKFEFANFHNEEKAKQSSVWFWTYFVVVVGALLIFTAGGLPRNFPVKSVYESGCEWLAMVKVMVRNTTSINVMIEEGHNQVYCVVKPLLKPNGKCTLDVDRKFTYKEYVLKKVSDGTTIAVFTGTEILKFMQTAEFKALEVKTREGSNPDEHYWEATYKDDRNCSSYAFTSTNQSMAGGTANN